MSQGGHLLVWNRTWKMSTGSKSRSKSMLLGTNTAYDFIKDVYEKGKDNIHVDKVQKQEQE